MIIGMKQTLSLCISDKEYQNRLVKGLMNHYGSRYVIKVYTTLAEYLKLENQENSILLAEGFTEEEGEQLKEMRGWILYLLEEGESLVYEKDKLISTTKYQELYTLEELVQKILGNYKVHSNSAKDAVLVGVFSLDMTLWQLPFSAMTASEYGEQKKTLILDLQAHSGLILAETEIGGEFGLEDFLAMATSENYSKNRMLEGICHRPNWDYIRPIKNSQRLAEASWDLYRRILDVLQKQLEYEVIIINFGDMFSGIYDFMEACQEFYLLVQRKESRFWRETVFQRELELLGKEDFLYRIIRMEMASVFIGGNEDWMFLEKQWRWSALGDVLRKHIWSGNIEWRDYVN